MIRIFDILIATTAIIILSPLLLIITFILRFTGENEILFLQPRVGLEGKLFLIYKFATMLKDSPILSGGTITTEDDPRILPVGKVLRKSKINELPQLFNVIEGTMSIVGPRPMTTQNFELYSNEEKVLIQKMKPGITGLGSIIFRSEEKLLKKAKDPKLYYERVIAPNKACLESWYAQNTNLSNYVKIILVTAWIVIKPTSKLVYRTFDDLPKLSDELVKDLELI
jgi:lipopolysaccharide/colanic/teichoic acid biosynthesis glycosyltransferase